MKLENRLDGKLDYISIWKALDRADVLEFTKNHGHRLDEFDKLKEINHAVT